jgi:fatty acid desaturase
MAESRLSGLRLWVNSMIHWPTNQIREKLEVTEHRLEEIRDRVQADVERELWRFERMAVAWAITALLLAIAGIFFLIGLWVGLSTLFGPVLASFLLAVGFATIAPIPLLVLRSILRARRQ